MKVEWEHTGWEMGRRKKVRLSENEHKKVTLKITIKEFFILSFLSTHFQKDLLRKIIERYFFSPTNHFYRAEQVLRSTPEEIQESQISLKDSRC